MPCHGPSGTAILLRAWLPRLQSPQQQGPCRSSTDPRLLPCVACCPALLPASPARPRQQPEHAPAFAPPDLTRAAGRAACRASALRIRLVGPAVLPASHACHSIRDMRDTTLRPSPAVHVAAPPPDAAAKWHQNVRAALHSPGCLRSLPPTGLPPHHSSRCRQFFCLGRNDICEMASPSAQP